MKRYLIIGGVAGGATAATRLRRRDEEAEIVLVERGAYISYASCGLPYYIGGEIEARESLLVMTPERLRANFAIDVRTETEAVSVDAAAKTVRLRGKDGSEEDLSYDALLLSPGARPIRPRIPGIESSRIHTLRTIPDADALHACARQGGRAAVIGGGFIGVEMAENLARIGLSVTLVEAAPHILAPFDADMAPLIERELSENGIALSLGDGVASFEEKGDLLSITLASGASLDVDFAVLAIGVTPDTAFLEGSGIERNERGFLLTDDRMRTSAPDVYAVGDAVESFDALTGAPMTLALAGPASRQARIAADNMAGGDAHYHGMQHTSILKAFSRTAAATGASERALRRAGLSYGKDFFIVLLHPFSHVTYYPGAEQMTVKLLFGADGRVLGAQIIGTRGVKARIDAIAAAIRRQASIEDLADIELAYAPPFGAPKDPVNLAGLVAQNLLTGLVSFVRVGELDAARAKGAQILDVREPAELLAVSIEGATNLPLGKLRTRYRELDKKTDWIVLCRVGQRAYNAARFLASKGFRAKVLMGGILSYRAERAAEKAAPRTPAATGAAPGRTEEAPKEDEEPAPRDAIARRVSLAGLSCPGPVMHLSKIMEELKEGEIAELTATDAGFYEDSLAWCRATGNNLLLREKTGRGIRVQVQKSAPDAEEAAPLAGTNFTVRPKTILVFSGDLDKALAAFILANGAAATGAKVTMFFTFWGLSVLRREAKSSAKKPLLARLFSAMLPKGASRLPLSNFHMMGLGTRLMKKIMRDHDIMSLESLIKSARDAGVELIVCQMTMDLMGIRKEELLDGVTIGGVAAFLEKAEQSSATIRF